MSFVAIQFELYADINGTTVELMQFAVSFELNQIPRCTAVLPVGYRAVPPHAISTAHTAVGLDTPLQVPMTVWVTSTAVGAPRVWPAGTYKIFCGWVTGVGYRRTYNGYAMTIEGTHWLSALSFSSTLSAISHPANPSHLMFDAILEMDLGGGGLLHWAPPTLAQMTFTGALIQDDMWSNCLYPWFAELACADRIDPQLWIDLGKNPANDGGTKEAMAALDLINLNPGELLEFDAVAVDADHAAAAIANDLSAITLNPSTASNTISAMAHTTFWDKIVGELSPKYFFSLVPFVDRAAIVPFTPGLNDGVGPWKTISAIDMSQQDMNAFLPRATRAVGFFAGHGARAGGNFIFDDIDDTIGGLFVGRDDGIVLFKRAPGFLSEYPLPYFYSGNSTGVKGAPAVRGNAHNHPGVGTVAGAAQPVALKADGRLLLNKLAEAMYVNELLKNRYGDIVGPVRFDICPGSTIGFEGTAGATQPPGAGETRYGEVLRVSHFFDAQHQKCYTAFRVGYVRTQDEHDNVGGTWTVARHPLYTNVWKGDENLTLGVDACPDMQGFCPPPP